jgi:serine/threonine protein kinase
MELMILLYKLPDAELGENNMPLVVVQEMQYINGGTLAKMLKGIRFSQEQIESAWIQLLYCFYLTQKDFCFTHNDIKPDNILVSYIDKEEDFDIGNGYRLHLPVGSAHFYISDFGLSWKTPRNNIESWLRSSHGIGINYPILYLSYKEFGRNDLPPKGPNVDLW